VPESHLMKIGCLIGIWILVIGMFWFSFHNANFCRGAPFDAAPSPTGTRVAEKQDCGRDEYDDFQLFVRRTGAISHFLEPERSLRLNGADAVGYVWVGDQQLLIASPRVDDIADMPDHLGEVAVSYSLYPTNSPESAHDPSSFIAVRRDIEVRYRFEADQGHGMPGVGCNLYVEADAAPELKTIGLRISANRTFQAKAWNAQRLVDVPEHVGSAILFTSASDYARPVAFVTAAALDDIEVEKKGLAIDSWQRQRKPARVPAGGFAPSWQIMWGMSEPALQRSLDKFRAGQFEIRIGYWFDNKEFIYVNSIPGATKPIEEFAQCARSGIYPGLH
jgi:hypothetical protein